jgi:tetratricopeptide (TPR) repeat protein
VVGEGSSAYALDLNNLGLLYYKMVRYLEAEPLFKEALRVFRQSLGQEHPSYGVLMTAAFI